ncbi:MAG TPA: hydrolase [Burkholderiales bacterium]|nr:hydrolase [Burkholderiales bacterium]
MNYRAPWWLPGGNLQTIYPFFALQSAPPHYRRERVNTDDGDFVDFDWLDAGGPASPVVVLFHGLEGCSRSHYASAIMQAVGVQGWRGVVPHFRGCSGEANRLPRAYHSGDADEIGWMLNIVRERIRRPVFAAGVSLGGNALLKWLAREGSAAGQLVQAAAAISAPIDLTAAGARLSAGLGRVYGRHFLHSLKRKGLEKHARYPGLFDRDRVEHARTLREFDDAFTAPLHGFRDVDDYWHRASSKRDLGSVRVPTLLVHARNDPFLPGSHLPAPQELPGAIESEFLNSGGHVGFVSGRPPGTLDWLPARLLRFLSARA